MRKYLVLGSLAGFLLCAAVGSAAEPSDTKPFPDELTETWERFQQALQDWGGRLWERFGTRGSREDRPVISQLLNNKDALGLSPEQVRKLEQLRDNFQKLSIRSEADLRIVELDIAALLDNDPVEMGKVESKMREAEKLRVDLRIARVRAIEQAKGQLNAEQKKKLQDLNLHVRVPRKRGAENPSAKE